MKEAFLLRIPKELKDWLQVDASKRGLTLTGLIMAVLSEYRQQNGERRSTTYRKRIFKAGTENGKTFGCHF